MHMTAKKKRFKLYIDSRKLSFGRIFILASDQELYFLSNKSESAIIAAKKFRDSELIFKSNSITKKTFKQLQQYINGKLKKFDLPLKIIGTQFQQHIWQELKKIPYAKHKQYKQIAQALGKPNASRAVGNAIAANPVPIIIPCHRVLAKNGPGGFSLGLKLKKILLNIESQHG